MVGLKKEIRAPSDFGSKCSSVIPHAVKVLILVTDSLKGVKEGGIGRRHISKGAPVQPLQVKLNLTTKPLLFMLGAPIQPLQVMLDLNTQPLQVKLIFII